MANERSVGSRVLPILLVLGAFLALRGLHLALSHRLPLSAILGPKYFAIVIAEAGSLGLASWVAWREWTACEASERYGTWSRWLIVCVVLGWLAFLGLVQPFQRIWFDLSLGVVPGVWAGILLVVRDTRAGRWAEFAFFSVSLAALGTELGLRGWALAKPSPLNARVGAAPGELVNRFRCAPGEVRFGFACNSQGFYDEEFYRKRPDEEIPRIVAIGDSFNVGTVPHAWHFTTICEDLLDVRVDNFGVPGIGPAEYVSLLVKEALPLDPDLILIGVFVGNDLNVYDAVVDLPDVGLRRWFQRDQVLLFVLPERWGRLGAEQRRLAERGGDLSATQGERGALRELDREAAAEEFAWVLDPSLEVGTYSAEAFHRIELQRALDISAQDPPSLELFYESMRAAKRAAGDIPVRVMLIPDEFQVEDDLWQVVEELSRRPLERDRAQRILTHWLEREGIAHLDLLPILREVEVMESGRRHLYHLRDTHFNGRGNERTAQALAEFLREDVAAIRAGETR